jgi:hypothetical protein
VDDLNMGGREKVESGEKLEGEFADEIEGDAAKVGQTQEIVEIVGEKLEDDAQVLAVHKVVKHTN